MSFHRDKTGADIHTPYFATYADATARGAATPGATDVGKIAWQTDNNSVWLLTDDSPLTWVQVGGAGVSGAITIEEGNASEGTATTLDFDDSDFNVTVAASEADISLNYGAGAGQPAEGNHTHAATVGVTLTFGDGSAVLTSAELPQYVEAPVACTVVSWKVVSVNNVSGSITFLVHRAAAGSPTTFSEISGSSDPALSAATSNEDTSIAGDWSDVTLDAGDILRVAVDGSPASVTRVAVMLRLTRSV
jgi:hypothetical protein